MGTRGRAGLGRARALQRAERLPACTASGSTATTCWPCARPPRGCSSARAGAPPGGARDDHLPLPRPLRRRRRARLPHARGDRRAPPPRPDRPLRGAPKERGPASTTTRSRRCASEVSAEVAEPSIRVGRRRRRLPDPATRLLRQASRRCARLRARAVRRGAGATSRAPLSASARGRAAWRTMTYREALRLALRRGDGARRARLPDGRGGRPLRRLLQGDRRPAGRSTAPTACATRRSPRRASSAPASARRCSASGRSSRS